MNVRHNRISKPLT